MTKKHILFIVENSPVPNDLRVWGEALAAREAGYHVSVICPFDNSDIDNREFIDGIRIYRHHQTPEKSSRGALVLEYLNAAFWEIILAINIYASRPFQIIHAANPPDYILLITFPFKLFGVKFIFDHHDIVPENYVAKFGKKGLIYKILRVMEWLTFQTATVVISTNESYKRIAIERGNKKEESVHVVRNGPDPSRIRSTAPNLELRKGFNYLVGYVGVIGQQEGIDNLLQAVKYLVKERRRADIKFVVVGSGPHLDALIQQAQRMGVSRYVHFTGFLSDEALFEVLSTSDICINPEFRNEFTDKSTMIKIMEYMALGKPIVQFYTVEGEYTAGESAVYIRENKIDKFADAIVDLLEDPERQLRMGTFGKKRIKEELEWSRQKQELINIYQHFADS